MSRKGTRGEDQKQEEKMEKEEGRGEVSGQNLVSKRIH